MIIEEHWMRQLGGTMPGTSRTVRTDILLEYKVVLLREQGSRLAYEAHPSGHPSAIFLSDVVSDTMVVFGNSSHDSPQRIGCRRSVLIG